jgi:hypothetical protein
VRDAELVAGLERDATVQDAQAPQAAVRWLLIYPAAAVAAGALGLLSVVLMGMCFVGVVGAMKALPLGVIAAGLLVVGAPGAAMKSWMDGREASRLRERIGASG